MQRPRLNRRLAKRQLAKRLAAHRAKKLTAFRRRKLRNVPKLVTRELKLARRAALRSHVTNAQDAGQVALNAWNLAEAIRAAAELKGKC